MPFDIKRYYEDNRDYYGNASLEDVAKDAFSRGGYDKEYPSFDDWKKRAGISDHIEYDALQRADSDKRSQQTGVIRRFVGDPLVSAAKGVVGLGEAAVGLADIPTMGYAGKGLEALGYRPKVAQQNLEELYSNAQQEANRKVQDAKGFVPTVVEAVKNPSTIAHSVIESVPSMLGGGAIARGLLKGGLVGASKVAPAIAGGIGEGAVTAGATAESIRQDSETGTLTPTQSAIAGGAGVMTGLIGVMGGKLAARLGIDDVDTLMAGGKTADVADPTALAKKKSVLRRVAESAISEGALEELPQSAQEQFMQNLATGKPATEGVAEAAAQGMLAGLVMGGMAPVYSKVTDRGQPVTASTDEVPETRPPAEQPGETTDDESDLEAAMTAKPDTEVLGGMTPGEVAREDALPYTQQMVNETEAIVPEQTQPIQDEEDAIAESEAIAAERQSAIDDSIYQGEIPMDEIIPVDEQIADQRLQDQMTEAEAMPNRGGNRTLEFGGMVPKPKTTTEIYSDAVQAVAQTGTVNDVKGVLDRIRQDASEKVNAIQEIPNEAIQTESPAITQEAETEAAQIEPQDAQDAITGEGIDAGRDANADDAKEITAIHYSRKPITELTDEDVADEESVMGYGFYAMEPKDEPFWQSVDRWDMGPHRNEVKIKPKNPLVVTPENFNEIVSKIPAEDKTGSVWLDSWLSDQVRKGNNDALVIRGFDQDKTLQTHELIDEELRKTWEPVFKEGQTSGEFVNVDEFEKARLIATQKVLGLNPDDAYAFLNMQNQIFVPPNKAKTVIELPKQTSQAPNATDQLPILAPNVTDEPESEVVNNEGEKTEAETLLNRGGPMVGAVDESAEVDESDADIPNSDDNRILPNDKFITTTDRETTPYPKYSLKKQTRADERKTEKWLVDNARDEADSRGDDWNKTLFEQMATNDGLSSADVQLASSYLFGKEIPDTIRGAGKGKQAAPKAPQGKVAPEAIPSQAPVAVPDRIIHMRKMVAQKEAELQQAYKETKKGNADAKRSAMDKYYRLQQDLESYKQALAGAEKDVGVSQVSQGVAPEKPVASKAAAGGMAPKKTSSSVAGLRKKGFSLFNLTGNTINISNKQPFTVNGKTAKLREAGDFYQMVVPGNFMGKSIGFDIQLVSPKTVTTGGMAPKKAAPQSKTNEAEVFSRDSIVVSKPTTTRRKRAGGTDGESVTEVSAPLNISDEANWYRLGRTDGLRVTVEGKFEFKTGLPPKKTDEAWSVYSGKNLVASNLNYKDAIEKAKDYVYSANPKAEAKQTADAGLAPKKTRKAKTDTPKTKTIEKALSESEFMTIPELQAATGMDKAEFDKEFLKLAKSGKIQADKHAYLAKAEPGDVVMDTVDGEQVGYVGAKMAQVSGDDIDFQSVWHGTPHVWPPEPGFPHGRPRLDKIFNKEAVGEGAWANGAGFYTAGEMEVGDEYRNRLSDYKVSFRGEPINPIEASSRWLKEKFGLSQEDASTLNHIIVTIYNDPRNKGVDGARESFESLLDLYSDNDSDIAKQEVQKFQRYLDFIEKNGKDLKQLEGSLYKLEIPNDVLPKLLDWDRPLSEQTEYVKKALEKAGVAMPVAVDTAKAEAIQRKIDQWDERSGKIPMPDYTARDRLVEQLKKARGETGREIYQRLAREKGGPSEKWSDIAASKYLAKIGIPGNTHGGMSGGKTGAKYVIWDQAVLDEIALLERNGQVLEAMQESMVQANPKGLPVDQVQSHLAPIIKNAGAKVTIFDGYDDPKVIEFSKALNEHEETKNRIVRGFRYKDRVYVNAAAVDDLDTAESVLLHELVGHFGLHEFMGSEADQFFDMLSTNSKYRPAVLEMARRRGINTDTRKGMRKAASEFFAESVENKTVEPTLWTRFVKLFRDAMRRLGFSIEFGDAELAEVVRGAYQSAMKREARQSGINEFAQDVSYSLPKAKAAILDNAAFREWFGGSVVTVDGKPGSNPLVVHHGARSEKPVKFFFGGAFAGWFAENPKLSDEYSKSVETGEYDSYSSVYPVYLSIQNPLDLRSVGVANDFITPSELHKKAGLPGSVNEWYQGDPDEPETLWRTLNSGAFAGFLSDNGYDGLIINEKSAGVRSTTYAPLSSNQIKSIFNQGTFDPENPDISFSFAGEKARNADTGTLKSAKDMEAAGVSRDDIWRDTGWWRGYDGRWRFEVDDSKSKWNVSLLTRLKGSAQKLLGREQVYRLSDYLDHKDIYRAYPELKKVAVKLDKDMDAGEAKYDESAKTITISGNMYIPDNSTWEESAKHTLLHEVQHAIQQIEGTAKGGSPDDGFLPKDEQDFVQGFQDRLDQIKSEMDEIEGKYPKVNFGSLFYEPDAKFLVDSGVSEEDAENYEALLRWHSNLFEKVETEKRVLRYIGYRSLTGEAEARLVQRRLDMTPSQRKAEPPWETMEAMLEEEELLGPDQKPEDVLINRGGDDISFSVTDFAKKQTAANAKLKAGKLKDTVKQMKDDVLNIAENAAKDKKIHEYGRPELSWWALHFSTPLYHKIPQLKQGLDAALRWVDEKHEIFRSLLYEKDVALNKTMTDYRKAHKDKFEVIRQEILDVDKDPTLGYTMREETDTENNTREFIVVPPARSKRKEQAFVSEGDAVKAAHQMEAEDFMARNPGFTEADVSNLKTFRNITNRMHVARTQELRKTMSAYRAKGLEPPKIVWRDDDGKKIKLSLQEAMQKMGDLRFTYMPRLRTQGRLQLSGVHPDGRKFKAFYDVGFENQQGSKLRWAMNYASPMEIKRRQLERDGYETNITRTDKLPENVFLEAAGKQMALGDILEEAFEKASEALPKNLKGIGIEHRFVTNKVTNEQDLVIYDYSSLKGIHEDILQRLGGKYEDKGAWGKSFTPRWVFKNGDEKLLKEITKQIFDIESINPNLDLMYAETMLTAVADVLKSRGSMGAMKPRVGDYWEGFETDPILAVTRAAQSLAGGVAKRSLAEKLMAIYKGTTETWEDYKAANGKDASYSDYRELVKKRRLDPSQQPKAVVEFKSMMNELLRNEETTDRVIGTLNGLAVLKYLAFRISGPLANLTSLPTTAVGTLSGRGNVDINRAMYHIGKAAKLAAQWQYGNTEFGKKRLGKKNPFNGNSQEAKDLKKVYDTISEKGWDVAQYNYEALSAIQSKAGQAYGGLIDWGMAMFGMSERINRMATIAGSFFAMNELKENEGKTFDEIMEQAKKISDYAHGVYSKPNRPFLTRGAGLSGNVGKALYLFQNFGHNYILNLHDIGISTPQARKAVAYLLLSPMVIGGLGAGLAYNLSLPVLNAILGMFGADSDDPEEDIYRWFGETFGNYGENLARFGAAGALGINLKGSIGMGNNFELPTKISDLFGAPGSMITDTFDGAKELSKGNYWKGFEKFFPNNAVTNVSAAVRQATEGVTKRSNAPVFYGNEPLKFSTTEAVLKAFSFNPAEYSAKRERMRSDQVVAKEYNDRKTEIRDRYRRFWLRPIAERNTDELRDILADVVQLNNRIRQKGLEKPVGLLTPKSLRQSIKRANTPNKLEKYRAAMLTTRGDDND